MIKKLPKNKFDLIYSKVPRLCIEVVIKTPQGILLTLRDIPPGKGRWHLPGGTVMYGESLAEAVKRVAKDEVGVDVEIVKSFAPLEWTKPHNSFLHTVSIPYLVKILKGHIRLNNQASDYRFFKKIPKNTLIGHKEFLTSKQVW